MVMISYTIYLFQIQTSVIRTSRHYFISKKTDKTSTKNTISKLEGESSSYVGGIYISTHLDACCYHLHRRNYHAFKRSPFRKIRMTYKSEDYRLQADALFQKG